MNAMLLPRYYELWKLSPSPFGAPDKDAHARAKLTLKELYG
jgi:hypothetical protein